MQKRVFQQTAGIPMVLLFVDRIYPIELEIKDTTYTDRSASYLELHDEIDSEGWLK